MEVFCIQAVELVRRPVPEVKLTFFPEVADYYCQMTSLAVVIGVAVGRIVVDWVACRDR